MHIFTGAHTYTHTPYTQSSPRRKDSLSLHNLLTHFSVLPFQPISVDFKHNVRYNQSSLHINFLLIKAHHVTLFVRKHVTRRAAITRLLAKCTLAKCKPTYWHTCKMHFCNWHTGKQSHLQNRHSCRTGTRAKHALLQNRHIHCETGALAKQKNETGTLAKQEHCKTGVLAKQAHLRNRSTCKIHFITEARMIGKWFTMLSNFAIIFVDVVKIDNVCPASAVLDTLTFWHWVMRWV